MPSAYVHLDDVNLTFRRVARRNSTLRDAIRDSWKRRRSGTQAEPFCALTNISLRFDLHERVAIIGRNGSGKSTLLRVIAGIYRPTSGTVQRRGSIVSLLEAGLSFHPELTGRENVLQAAALFGIPKQEMKEKIPEIVAFAETEEFVDTPVKYYSKGMRTRLAFSMATSTSPDILLLDEALSGGDFSFRERAEGRIRELFQRTKIVVMATHNMRAVVDLCDRAIRMYRGRVIRDGEPSSIADEYEGVVRRVAELRRTA